MWILVAIFIGLAVVLLGFLLFRKERKMSLAQKGNAVGGIAGALLGIALVEFAGFEYPFPVILWLLGMGLGQTLGTLLEKQKKR